MRDASETIAAIATAPGRGAIGIVRVSGPRASDIVAAVVGRDLRSQPRRLSLATARRAGGAAIDSVLAVLMPGPNSFTGEDVAEIHCHGGTVAVAEVLKAALAAGARAAEAGEFSRRAFENDRMDLTQAEGILAVISAGSERSLRVGNALLAGELRSVIDELRQQCDAVLASVEAGIDFPEDVVDGADIGVVRSLVERLVSLASTGAVGRALRDGITVALTGDVNAGKSSLFNALIGKERALVAEEPGTTRDYVEANVVWAGVEVTLIDTAGNREAEGLEGRGIELGKRRASECDLEIVVVPSGASVVEAGPRQLVVWSKCDLKPAAVSASRLATSAKSGAGLESLRAAVLSRATGDVGLDESTLLISARQRELVAEALTAAQRAESVLETSGPPELAAADLQVVRGALARLVGEELNDEMLDSLFAQFCIGK